VGSPSIASVNPPSAGTIFVRSPVIEIPSTPPPRRKPKQAPVASSLGVVPGIPPPLVRGVGNVPLGNISVPSFVNRADPLLTRKRSALAPPSSAVPSSSKVLRQAQSTSAIRRTSSAVSSSSSLPSPLVFSPSLPSHLSLAPPVLPARMVVDPSEDQVLLLLDALEFAIDKGNLVDARKRIQALRKLRQQEKGYPGV